MGLDKAQRQLIYEYDHLEITPFHFRLLRIYAGFADHAPSISLQTFELNSAPAFTALSYTWGDDKPSNPVYIRNHKIDCGVLCVSKNLHDFLAMASNTFERLEGRWFWIDQVSIDQGNTLELEDQVSHMADVFSQAELVLIWLGPGFEGSSEIVASIQDYEDTGELSLPALQSLPDALEQFVNLSWWSRLWVCQEVVLARALIAYAGKDLFYADTKSWLDWLSDVGSLHTSNNFKHAYPLFRRRRNLAERPWTIERSWADALELSKNRNCTLPHDKFYGMLGLVHPGLRVRADYDLSLDDVFLTVLRLDFSLKWGESHPGNFDGAFGLDCFAEETGVLWCYVEQAVNHLVLSLPLMSKHLIDQFIVWSIPRASSEERRWITLDAERLTQLLVTGLTLGYKYANDRRMISNTSLRDPHDGDVDGDELREYFRHRLLNPGAIPLSFRPINIWRGYN